MGSPWPEDRSAVEIAATVTTNEPRINDRIRAREVRLVDPDGEQLGIKSLTDALNLAREQDLDLVEVAPLANPPVARIMDYGKFKFDAAQRAKESKRKAVHVGIKEMKYRPKIGPGDFDTKTRQVAKFLEEGHKVKITIMFRGREVFHPELGKKILDRIAEQMEGMGKSESDPRLDGRNMVMVLAPDKRAKQSAASRGPKSGGNPANGSTPEVAPEVKAAEPAPTAEAAAPEAAAPAAAAPAAPAPAAPAPDATEAVATAATPDTATEPAPAEEKIKGEG
ncbi:MAG TPA: translation initiation factor IF-3 [Acidimicrobiales bacterium]|jgi:translation initiation factor IF-3|nr:translation initiation factor IF-3 [Acidimicrobiales bacterium]